MGKTANKTFGKAEVIIRARLKIPTKEPLTFLFFGLINVEFCMKELNGSILFKYCFLQWKLSLIQKIQKLETLKQNGPQNGKQQEIQDSNRSREPEIKLIKKEF